ncbi:MAG: Two component transcriptional regulator, winged helix family protein [Acidobacteria bacterium]|nr:Two component transcriptional regulator, winged helix family protein [Acidobacteriota bacterium]
MKALAILVVDDDDGIRRSLESELRAAGYATTGAADGNEGVRRFRSDSPDLILTDLSMPAADGFHLIQEVRKSSNVAIIVLSVRGGESDKIRALDLGADDFVVKPFSVAELLARVRAQLRRTATAEPNLLEFPGLTIDFERRRIAQGEREIRLTPTEYALLDLLARNAGKPITTDQIIDKVWSGAPGTTNDTVRVHMAALRRKIEPDPSNPRYIVTEPWIGFRFIAEPLR